MPIPSEISIDSSITGFHARIDQWPSAFLKSTIFFNPFLTLKNGTDALDGRLRHSVTFALIWMCIYVYINMYTYIYRPAPL